MSDNLKAYLSDMLVDVYQGDYDAFIEEINEGMYSLSDEDKNTLFELTKEWKNSVDSKKEEFVDHNDRP